MRAISARSKSLAPPGTLVNPLPPAPVAARGLTGYRIANAVMGALAQVAPCQVPARQSGGRHGYPAWVGTADLRRVFVFLEFLVCSWGGRPCRDGIDGVASMVVNFSNYPVGSDRARVPTARRGIRIPARVPRFFSGEFCGGLALVRRYLFLEAVGNVSDQEPIQPLQGLRSGGRRSKGSPSRNVLNPGPERARAAAQDDAARPATAMSFGMTWRAPADGAILSSAIPTLSWTTSSMARSHLPTRALRMVWRLTRLAAASTLA